MQAKALFILDEEDERIHELTQAFEGRRTVGMAGFACEPETKTVIGTRKDGSSFSLSYREFERWFVPVLSEPPITEPLLIRQTTEDERLSAKIIATDLNGRLKADSTVERFFVDTLAEEVVQINVDGTRRAIPVRGFVKLFPPNPRR